MLCCFVKKIMTSYFELVFNYIHFSNNRMFFLNYGGIKNNNWDWKIAQSLPHQTLRLTSPLARTVMDMVTSIRRGLTSWCTV